MTQTTPRRAGRPATGETPQRRVRMGPLWDSCAELAAELDITMTEFVERALRAEHARVQRELDKKRAEAERAAAAAALPVPTELNDDQGQMMYKVRLGVIHRDGRGDRVRWAPNGFFVDLTQGEELMLDKLIEAEMVLPYAQPAQFSVLPKYNLTEKGKAALIEWEQAQER